MVKLLMSSTTVFNVPSPCCKCSWPRKKRLGEAVLHVGEAGKQAAEHQDFGGEKQPDADFDGIELLLRGGEVVPEIRVVMGVSYGFRVLPFHRRRDGTHRFQSRLNLSFVIPAAKLL